MTGLYLMLVFRIAFANACLGVALYGWFSYSRQRGRTLPPAVLRLIEFVKWFGHFTFGLLIVLWFWPLDPAPIDDFFHSVNRVLHIF